MASVHVGQVREEVASPLHRVGMNSRDGDERIRRDHQRISKPLVPCGLFMNLAAVIYKCGVHRRSQEAIMKTCS
jgi:hypothetical protein